MNLDQKFILSYQWHTEQGIPVVFLHGLLGSQQDWQQTITLLQNFPKIRPLTIDLPFHGLSKQINCTNFSELRVLLNRTLTTAIGSQAFYLVGYSLGGRAILDYTLNINPSNLLGAVLEGANIGLNSEIERQSRWKSDCQWAERFRNEPIEYVLKDWYQQAVFTDLTTDERTSYIAQRKHNCGESIAKMLEATSLAKQPNYAAQLKQTNKKISFFIGEKDRKFRQMAEQNHLPTQLIPNSGHNSHKGNTLGFIENLLQFIGE